ncbi:hypothetical protein GCM10008983_07710 [Lentibacillus halophilus]|uniref:Ankyrin repeat-containing protein n=1 Tax=Lentibacillus halophilus TaxID=295065 RepID=A0ABN0Z4U0_9BACI
MYENQLITFDKNREVTGTKGHDFHRTNDFDIYASENKQAFYVDLVKQWLVFMEDKMIFYGDPIQLEVMGIGIEQAKDNLIKVNGDSEVIDSDNFFRAIANNNADKVNRLIEKGADPNMVTDQGTSALITALQHENPTIVKKLLDAGADPNLQGYHMDYPDTNPLDIAIEKNNVSLIKMLLENGANPNQTHVQNLGNKDMETNSLINAIELENVKAVEMLLKHGANAQENLKDGGEGITPIDYAEEKAQWGVSSELEKIINLLTGKHTRKDTSENSQKQDGPGDGSSNIGNNKKETAEQDQSKSFSYESYTNSRFGFSVDYPTTFSKEDAPTNNDGREFTNNEASILAYGSHINVLEGNETIETYYNRAIESNPGSIAYQQVGSDWYVISFKEGNDTIYEKAIIEKDIISTLKITYPTSRQSYYKPMVTHISEGFEGAE